MKRGTLGAKVITPLSEDFVERESEVNHTFGRWKKDEP